MSEWTDSARRVLDDYCARAKQAVAGTGADGEEVVADLRRHVDEEARAVGLTVVTEDDVRRILNRVGEPEAAEPAPTSSPAPAPAAVGQKEKNRPGVLLLILGVILPAISIGFELATGMSAGVLFDPFPSRLNVLLVALVPLANYWVWRAGRARDARRATLLGWLNGAALGVAIYYSVLYLPFLPSAAFAVIAFGLGLIPLGPFFALAATPVLWSRYRERIGRKSLPGRWRGAWLSLSALVLLQLPTAATFYGLSRLAADDAATRRRGVQVLRAVGDQELLLRACYGTLQRELDCDLVRQIANGGAPDSSPDLAREAYYRVTGKPFNAVPPPALYTRAGRWSMADVYFTGDDALGGEAVAGRVKGLSLLSSRMDAVAEPDAALVYCEWTMEFKNISHREWEARAQIALPPGGVVSRVTLWINGEEREAAFGGRVQTRKAYQEVAVEQRQDPVLVTTCGPDRILMQCFPVQPDGGIMKVRIGITAPLALQSLEQGQFVWPRFLERNFSIGAGLKHALWIESPAPLGSTNSAPAPARSETRPFNFHEAVAESGLAAAPRIIEVRRRADVTAAWTPTDDPGQIIRQTIQPLAPAMPARLVVVLDGTEGPQASARELAEALAGVPETTEIAVLVARDDVTEFNAKPQKATREAIGEIQRGLGRVRFDGGQDNLPALEAAWDLAAAVENGAVLWIHQPQAVLLSSESGLVQRLERTGAATRLYELQIRNGPDRVVEKLDGSGAVEHVLPSGSLRTGLEKLLARWTGRNRGFQLVRERTATPAEAPAGARASKHLERLWAQDEALRLAARRQLAEAVQLAASRQLVTPLTGAVVLETREQYDRHELKPADPDTVPAIPEPSTLSLVGVAMLAWALRRSTRRRQPSSTTDGLSP